MRRLSERSTKAGLPTLTGAAVIPSRPRQHTALCCLVAAVALLTACAPSWSPEKAADPSSQSGPEGQAAEQTDTDGLGQYRATALGKRIRSKRLTVVMLSVGDTAVYEHQSKAGATTLTAVLRSYTRFKSGSIEDLREFLAEVKAKYHTADDEIDTVRRFVEQAIADVTYYRLDARYRLGAANGAIQVYEFREDGKDRPLGAFAIAPSTALAIVHYADADGFALGPDETLLAEHFSTTPRDGKLEIKPR